MWGGGGRKITQNESRTRKEHDRNESGVLKRRRTRRKIERYEINKSETERAMMMHWTVTAAAAAAAAAVKVMLWIFGPSSCLLGSGIDSTSPYPLPSISSHSYHPLRSAASTPRRRRRPCGWRAYVSHLRECRDAQKRRRPCGAGAAKLGKKKLGNSRPTESLSTPSSLPWTDSKLCRKKTHELSIFKSILSTVCSCYPRERAIPA